MPVTVPRNATDPSRYHSTPCVYALAVTHCPPCALDSSSTNTITISAPFAFITCDSVTPGDSYARVRSRRSSRGLCDHSRSKACDGSPEVMEACACSVILRLFLYYRPNFGPDAGLPTLPCLGEATLTRVLTHRSVHARPAHRFEDDDANPDNEKCV
jgi:hypothetical protein